MSRVCRCSFLLVLVLTAGLLGAVSTTAPLAVAASGVPAAPAAPAAAGALVGLTPTRVLDTRSGVGAPDAPVAPDQPLHVTVAGRGSVPAGAAAVVLTVTVVGTTSAGYLSAYPTGGSVPTASVLNWRTGETLAGSATVTLGTGGAFDLLVRGARPVELVADVSGYVTPGVPTAAGAYVARPPVRLLDTRTGNGAPVAKLPSGGTLHVTLAGRAGLPAPGSISAVVATLTAVAPAGAGYLTVWPGGTRPTVSALNFAGGQVRANQVTVPLGADGGLDLYGFGGPLDVVLDVTGYVIAGPATAPGMYVPVAPSRVYDTRRGGSAPAPGYDAEALIAGRGGVPRTGVAAVVANLTVTTTTSSGYLTAWPQGQPVPVASNLNWVTGQTVANQATLALGHDGAIGLHQTGATRADVVVDLSGYYLSAPPATPTGLTATVTAPGTPRQAVALTWDAPSVPVDGWTLRRAEGPAAPTTPDAGTAGPVVATGAAHSALDEDVQPGTTYSYALFARDAVPNYSAAATVTVTVPAIDPTALQLRPPTDLPRPPGASADAFAFVWDLECPAAGSCTGVGQITGLVPSDPSALRPYVLVQRNGTWTAPAVPLPADAATTTTAVDRLTSVDCGGPDACVAVGTYLTTSGSSRPLVTRVTDGAVTSATVPLPDASRTSSAVAVSDVSCPAAATCLAVGSYRTDTATVPLGIEVDDTGVRTVPATIAAGVTGTQPGSVSCSGPDSCVAVGRWGSTAAGGRTHALTGRWDGSSWTYADVPRPTGVVDGTMLLLAVACTDATHCTATGTGSTRANGPVGLRATGDGVSWTVTVPPQLPASTTYGGYLQCRDATTCLAAYRVPGTTTLVTSTAAAVTAVKVPTPDGATSGVSTFDLGCDAEFRCVLPGIWSTGDVTPRQRAMLTTVVDGVVSTEQVGPVVAPTPGTLVTAARVGCAPDGSCVMTGWVSRTGSATTGFLQTFQLPS